ncbi:hypothetical protein GGP77_001595 [Salinibacter ruber]|jgi:hypothetical protein|nr:hypothetical protein [Salinibacter ruber]
MAIFFRDATCPYCGADATIQDYTHCPGGRRLGQESIISLDWKDCECEWDSSDSERALLIELGEVESYV